jgi:hypothetical protein
MWRFAFFKVKTRRVLTWPMRFFILAAVLILLWASWPLICIAITNYIYNVGELHPASRILAENWDGRVEFFEGVARVAEKAGATEVATIIFEESYKNPRQRRAYYINAWAAGIDTAHLSLIIVPNREPKTLNIAKTVLDTAYQRHWSDLTIVTFDLHSARSGKAYRFAAKPYNISVTMIGIPIEGVNYKNWTWTSTGLSFAFSELIKKLYYDFYVF